MTSSDPYQTVAIHLPAAALPFIDGYVERSGLPASRFYTTAMTMGARATIISLEPLGTLSPSLRKRAAHSAEKSFSPTLFLKLTAGNDADLSAVSNIESERVLQVSILKDIITKLGEITQQIGIDREKLYAYAFTVGIQILARSLESDSTIPLDVIVQAAESEISPSVLAQALIKQQSKGRTKD